MSNTVKKHAHVFENKGSSIECLGGVNNGRINNRRDLNCYFVGGTTVLGERKPMAELESVTENHDESGLLKFINELSLDNKQKIIESLQLVNVDKCDLPHSYFNAATDIDEQKPMAELEPLFGIFPVKK